MLQQQEINEEFERLSKKIQQCRLSGMDALNWDIGDFAGALKKSNSTVCDRINGRDNSKIWTLVNDFYFLSMKVDFNVSYYDFKHYIPERKR